MHNVLIVEDSEFFGNYLKSRIEKNERYRVLLADSCEKAETLLQEKHGDIFIALMDLNLPDAPEGDLVDRVISLGIPVIVITGDFDDNVRDRLWSKPIVDYILKDRLKNIDYVLTLINRIDQNPSIEVLVVDDSDVLRQQTAELLAVRRYKVHEARDGMEALSIMENNPSILLVVTDCVMPRMDGFQLINRLRATRGKNDLAIIGISAHGNHLVSAKYIKYGASDFITKPFVKEEFYSRVMMHIDFILHNRHMKSVSARDPLTQLYNRRYLKELGGKLHAVALRQQSPLAVALLDIDDFKAINDQFGHNGGDRVLEKIGGILQGIFRCSDIVARYGGEEFCIIAVNMSVENVYRVFELVRKKIENARARTDGDDIRFTVSIGVTHVLEDSLEKMIGRADRAMYQAKKDGKNRVAIG